MVVVLLPVLTTHVEADDFGNVFIQYSNTGVDFLEAAGNAWGQTKRSGHYSYVGNQTLYAFNVLWISADRATALSLQHWYSLTKLAVYLGAIVAAARYLRRSLAARRRPISVWAARWLVALPLLATLQLHNLWCHDPVASYPLSGFVSAAIGFLVLTLAVSRVDGTRIRDAMVLGAAICGAIAYYEINVALIPAIAVMSAMQFWARAQAGASFGEQARRAARLLPAIVGPTAIVVIMTAVSANLSQGYTGTSVALGWRAATTAFRATIGTLPAAAWWLSHDTLGRSHVLLPGAIVGLLVVGWLVFATWRTVWVRERLPTLARWEFSSVAGPVATYALCGIAIQAATDKTQTETERIGEVYNFYAGGTLALAILFALCWLAVGGRRPTGRRVLGGALVAVAVVQFALNWELRDAFNTRYAVNGALLREVEAPGSLEERCTTIEQWIARGWPEYYSSGVVAGVEARSIDDHGQPFCPAIDHGSPAPP